MISDDRPLSRRSLLGSLGALGVTGVALKSLRWPSFGAVAADAATTAAASGVCVLQPEMTQGPYYLDLDLVRRDITEGSVGVPVQLAVNVVGADNCGPIGGVAVDLWHADAYGHYSGFAAGGGGVGTTFLRGTQVTDTNGVATFDTIFPGWYSGRAVHMHLKVHLADTTHTGQLFFSDTDIDAIYAANAPYSSRPTPDVRNAADNIYANGGAAGMVTLTANGSGGYLGSVTLGVTGSGNSVDNTPATVGSPSAFTPLATPTRLLDTRTSGTKPAAGSTTTLAIAGAAGIPAGASAVVLNVTATDATAAGYVTVWPEGDLPLASNLNVERAGQTRANLVTVPVGSDGQVRLFTSGGAHLVADAVGWYVPTASSAAGRFQPLTPGRLLDTRTGNRPAAATTIVLPVAGRQGVPSTGVSAVALNVTATDAAAAGYVTVWPDGSVPLASSLNVESSGQTVPNQVIVPLGADGAVRLYTQTGTHLVVDVAGWYTDATAPDTTTGLYVPASPYRAMDTRPSGKLTAGASRTLELATTGKAAEGATAVVLNVTATEATAAGYVTVWPEGAMPTASSLNVDSAGQTVANHVVADLGADGAVRLFSQTGTHLVVDVNGWFTA